MVRAFVVPPAEVQAELLRRDRRQRRVERFDVHLRHAAKFVERQVRELDVPSHRQVGAVDLQDQPASAAVSYSGRMASAIAKRYSSYVA